MGIVTLPTKSPNLKVHHIHRDRLRFMVSTRNPLAQRSKLTLEEVASQPLIFPRTGFTRQVLDKLFRPYRSRIHVTMELPSIGMIKRFVGADAGVSFISESFAKDQVKAGEVKLLNVEGVDLYRELGLVYRRDRSLPRAAQALIALIREYRVRRLRTRCNVRVSLSSGIATRLRKIFPQRSYFFDSGTSKLRLAMALAITFSWILIRSLSA